MLCRSGPVGVSALESGAGIYTLRIAFGTNYCCYSRWLPAETADLRICEVTITTTGEHQIVVITDIPRRGRRGTESRPAFSMESASHSVNGQDSAV